MIVPHELTDNTLHSFGMDEDFFCLFLFLAKVSFFLADADMLLLPALGADRVATSLDDHALESLNSLAHFRVQLLLH